MYDHRKVVSYKKDGANIALLQHSNIIKNFDDVVKELVDALTKIWVNPFEIVKLWSIKFAENPDAATAFDENKDSYDRMDQYNSQGVAILTYLFIKKQINLIFKSDLADATE